MTAIPSDLPWNIILLYYLFSRRYTYELLFKDFVLSSGAL